MPSALAFIGGGLLEGVGAGLVESGKEKRERALADLEHARNLERDEAKLEGRRGLLKTEIGAREQAAETLAGTQADAATTATGRAATVAGKLATARVTAAGVATDVDIAAAQKLEENRVEANKRAVIANQNAASTAAAVQRLIRNKANDAKVEAARKLAKAAEKAAEVANDRKTEAAKQAAKVASGVAETTEENKVAANKRTVTAQQNATSAKLAADRLAKDRAAKVAAGVASKDTADKQAAAKTLDERKDNTAAEARIIAEHQIFNDFGKVIGVDHRAAGIDLRNRGFIKAAEAQERKGKAIATSDNRTRAEAQADGEVDDLAGAFSSDAVDFKKDGGSRTRFRARRVREIMAESEGKTPPPTREAATSGTEATPGRGRGGRASTATPAPAAVDPVAPGPNENPYVGDLAPADHPEAILGKGGFWYVLQGEKRYRVQKTQANSAGAGP